MIEEKTCSDSYFVLTIARHIDNPCVDSFTGQNIRGFYIRLAKEQMDSIQNPNLKRFLELKIEQYQ